MKVLVGSIVVVALSTAPASALTGAEFKQVDRDFASGYAMGVTEARVLVKDTDINDQDSLASCIYGANMNGDTLYDLVISWLNRNPRDLPMPALGAIYKAINEMCGR